MSNKISETETVIKRIVPYLERRGYDLQTDLAFEEPAILDSEFKKGFVDILVTLGKKTPAFLIEAKRDGTKISVKHRTQALQYGKSKKCLFVALTNGKYFELINTATQKSLRINDSAFNRIPRKSDLITSFIPQLKKDPTAEQVFLPKDKGLPFRPGLPLTKLNHLIQQAHNSIRKIEKNEEHAFSDFSKILFLKLLEEKWDRENVEPPYTYYFHELADIPSERADQVKTAITSMIATITANTKYGEVLTDPIKLKQNATYLSIVKKIASVSWNDCNLDSKGTAFEYFVRATLKGKKLGQYFTPRPLVRLMLHLGRWRQITASLLAGEPFKVLDPACGTGGFLVFAMNSCLEDIQEKVKRKELHEGVSKKIERKIKEETFFGVDAHEGVASSAKMNMIIAGDGHNNIRCADSLKKTELLPPFLNEDGEYSRKAHLILTNPPFGTSEAESLTKDDLAGYRIRSTKGQSLFVQKMIDSVASGSRIVTVIDEGVLNTASYKELRQLVLQECRIEYVVSLPDETFKPNKINVKSSVLVLKKRTEPDDELEDEYPICLIRIESLGYNGAGDEIRGFDLDHLIAGIEKIDPYSETPGATFDESSWSGFLINSARIVNDLTCRFDYKYWDFTVRDKITAVIDRGHSTTIREINQLTTRRGISPNASEYVARDEGFALVVKAGSSITKTGLLTTDGDYIELAIYNSFEEKGLGLQEGDILLASTGDGTLGKTCVYRNENQPAIADSHVTIIRVDQSRIYPEYLCDFLRKGFGADQINRLFTGSTGLIEIAPEDVDRIVIPNFPALDEQKSVSSELRREEGEAEQTIRKVSENLKAKEQEFYRKTF